MEQRTIAIVGAGFSGTLLALHLSRHCSAATRLLLIERRPEHGPGLAYSTDCSDRILNVPAGRMSAFSDQPLHFLDWLKQCPDGGSADAGSFVPRRLYGDYLRHLVTEAQRTAPAGRLALARGEIVAIARADAGLELRLRDGGRLSASMAVLATGNAPPAAPCRVPAHASWYRGDPWDNAALDGLPRDAVVVLIGSGLTMVDLVLCLLRRRHQGPIHALSRRGLMPLAHAGSTPAAVGFEAEDVPRLPRELARFLRVEASRVVAAGGCWQTVVDAMRPVTQTIWRGWSASERRRFRVHAQSLWDVHRHRMAASVADRIDAARASGQLRVHSGRITDLTDRGDHAEIVWRPRGAAETASLRAHRVVNCTGPATDVTRSTDPLTRSLLANGLAQPDPPGLGFQVTDDGALRGQASDILFGVGPVCRGALWESTAVPDIRVQCDALARRLAVHREPPVPFAAFSAASASALQP